MLIGFECTELINELKEDIAEFGNNERIAVWCKDYKGTTIYRNYDFINPESPIEPSELKKGEYIKIMTMGELLPLLDKQNSII